MLEPSATLPTYNTPFLNKPVFDPSHGLANIEHRSFFCFNHGLSSGRGGISLQADYPQRPTIAYHWRNPAKNSVSSVSGPKVRLVADYKGTTDISVRLTEIRFMGIPRLDSYSGSETGLSFLYYLPKEGPEYLKICAGWS